MWNTYPFDKNRAQICETADSFIENLITLPRHISTTSGTRHPLLPRWQYIYRGAANWDYRLTPTALRTESEDKRSYDKLWSIANSIPGIQGTIEDRSSEFSQRVAELIVISKFYQSAEEAGQPLPPIKSPELRNELLTGNFSRLAANAQGIDDENLSKSPDWPPTELLPIIALAQHYDLPTRLLDWSRNPFISTYFAASGAMRYRYQDDAKEKNLCVWATVGHTFNSHSSTEWVKNLAGEPNTFPAKIIQPPSAENPNLSLQNGVFTVVLDKVKNENIRKTEPDRREIHERLLDYSSTGQIIGNNKKPRFYALYLPVSEASALLLRLKHLGFGANKIFDGYHGSAEAVLEDAKLFGVEI